MRFGREVVANYFIEEERRQQKSMFGKNKKTSMTGWLGLIAVIAKTVHDVLTGQPLDIPTILTGVASIGLMNAKDDNVTGVGVNAKVVDKETGAEKPAGN